MPASGLITVGTVVRMLLGPSPQDAYLPAALSPVCGGDLTGVSYLNNYFFTLVKAAQTFT